MTQSSTTVRGSCGPGLPNAAAFQGGTYTMMSGKTHTAICIGSHHRLPQTSPAPPNQARQARTTMRAWPHFPRAWPGTHCTDWGVARPKRTASVTSQHHASSRAPFAAQLQRAKSVSYISSSMASETGCRRRDPVELFFVPKFGPVALVFPFGKTKSTNSKPARSDERVSFKIDLCPIT